MTTGDDLSTRWDDRVARWAWVGRPAAETLEERTRRRVWVHLLPLLFGLYVLAYVDRSNVSVAKFGMVKPPAAGGLGFDDAIIGFGSGIFFWGYWILEVPSTLSVERRGARWVFCRILVLWGIAASLMGFTGTPWLGALFGWLPQLPDSHGAPWSAAFRHWNQLSVNAESQFYFLRFMLGFFEGGFFPTVVMYLSTWFKADHRAKAMACFLAAMPLSNAFGAPLSQWISDHVAWGGLPGWRWIYILEGAAPVLAAAGVWFCLPDRPQTARWLDEDQHQWLLGELADEKRRKAERHQGAWKGRLAMVLLLTVVYFCQAVASYGIVFFLPSIIKAQMHVSETWSAWVAALWLIIAFAGMQYCGWRSDRRCERIGHAAVPLATVGVGLIVVGTMPHHPWVSIAAFVLLIGPAIYAHMPPFWSTPTMFLGSTAAASAIGFINMVGNLGGSVGPMIIGDAAKHKDFAAGLLRTAPFPLVGAAILLVLGYLQRRRLKDGG